MTGPALATRVLAVCEPATTVQPQRVAAPTWSAVRTANQGSVAARDRGWDLTGTPAFAPEFPDPAGHHDQSHEVSAAERQADQVGWRLARLLDAIPVAAGRLSRVARRAVEPFMGVPLTDVQLDAGPNARGRAGTERAHAVTEGSRISFAAGAFRPDSPSGRFLIGHELTHVAQQRLHGTRTPQRFAAVLNYVELARRIHKAVSGPGTDEEAIYRSLTELHQDPAAITLLESTYQRFFGETLEKALRGDLDDEELDFAHGLLGKPVASTSKQWIDPGVPVGPAGWDALARRLKAAAEHRTWGFLAGTDEEAIFAVLAPLSGDPAKIAEIKAAYARITSGKPSALVDMLHSELSGSELSYALQLVRVPDPHAGVQAQLSSAEVLAVRNELAPGSKVAPPPPPPVGGPAPPLPAPELWDGRAGAVDAPAKRVALKAQLTTALSNHLTRAMPDITPLVAAPKVPITALEGAANAAVSVTDAEYKPWYQVSAATPGQVASRSGFAFSQAAGNLLDATSPAARAASGIPISARSVARWIVEHDDPPVPPGAIQHMEAHNFDPGRTGFGEGTFLQDEVITPFITPLATRLQLEQYDQFGFALQPEPGKVVIPTAAVGSSLGTGGAVPNLVDRAMMWSTWHLAVHEYLHNLTHPAFRKATTTGVMREGFTEYFTKNVLTKVAPVAHLNPGLVTKVEGGIFTPPTTKALVGQYQTPPTYATDLSHVETVAKSVPGKDNAMRAAYFQGHVEALGIDPLTSQFEVAPPAVVDPSKVSLPAGITTLADLADRSGILEPAIRSANPGIAVPLPATVSLPGAREHRVAATFTGGVAGPSETDVQIASQNGVTVAALHKANPAVAWAALAHGQRILIPKRP